MALTLNLAASRRKAFGAFDEVENVELVPNKAYGFVNFYDKESAVEAKEKLEVSAPPARGGECKEWRGVLMRE
jgi:hypothetical protein